MLINFTKMQGCANDYIYIDCTNGKNPEIIDNIVEIAIDISRRHFSVGADGVVLICDSSCADAKMRMFNADGSEGLMCGNAIRCVGKFLYDNNFFDAKVLKIETLSGIKTLNLLVENDVCIAASVEMGKAEFDPKAIPVLANSDVIDEEIFVDDDSWRITCVSMGNPHVVTFVDNIDNIKIESIGPKFEYNNLFPERINTEFVEVVDSRVLNMRVWERGSGETFACGTGACASVAAAIKCGYCNFADDVCVHLKGGDLIICIDKDWNVRMTGPARTIYKGELIYER